MQRLGEVGKVVEGGREGGGGGGHLSMSDGSIRKVVALGNYRVQKSCNGRKQGKEG
jgi:hypothetical protein